MAENIVLTLHRFYAADGTRWAQVRRNNIHGPIPAGVPAVAFPDGIVPFSDGHDMDAYATNDLRELNDPRSQIVLPANRIIPAIIIPE